VIHPTAIIGEPPEHREWKPGDPLHHPEIDDSAQVNALATIDAGLREPTRIGARTLVMKHAYIGHDAQIGDDCEVGPGSVIAGHVQFGDRVRTGVNACVRPFIKVGEGARIGAGAVVVKDVEPGVVVAGNPARPLPPKT
jgi:acetyltransferase-like isoleucine patch superfamily enzyme